MLSVPQRVGFWASCNTLFVGIINYADTASNCGLHYPTRTDFIVLSQNLPNRVAYFRCLCGRNKSRASQLSRDGYEIRSINLNPVWRDEALSYRQTLPFKVTNGKVESI